MLARLHEVLTAPVHGTGRLSRQTGRDKIQVRGLSLTGLEAAGLRNPRAPTSHAVSRSGGPEPNRFEIDPTYWSSPERAKHVLRAAEIGLDILFFDTPEDAIAAAARCEARLREEMEAEAAGEPPYALLPPGPFAKPCPPKLVSVKGAGRGPLSPEIAAPKFLAWMVARGLIGDWSNSDMTQLYARHCREERLSPTPENVLRAALDGLPGAHREWADQRKNGKGKRPVVWKIRDGGPAKVKKPSGQAQRRAA